MNTLKTTFAGLELKNPLIAASCNRTNEVANNVALEQAGVSAIVLKSIFEENIVRQADSYLNASSYTESVDYLQSYLRNELLNNYVELIKESKAACRIPIIASINCFSKGEWFTFAKLLEEAGADAIELNIMSIQTDSNAVDGSFELDHIDIVRQVRAEVKLPLIVKLGHNYTNPIALIARLKAVGADAVVLFNRMYQTDINIDTLRYSRGHVLSVHEELALPLRWIAIASHHVKTIDYALSGGVHSVDDIAKAILVGASAVEVCSVLYQKGNGWIEEALHHLQQWQKKQRFTTVAQYRGLMNTSQQQGEERFLRTQFLKTFDSYHN